MRAVAWARRASIQGLLNTFTSKSRASFLGT